MQAACSAPGDESAEKHRASTTMLDGMKVVPTVFINYFIPAPPRTRGWCLYAWFSCYRRREEAKEQERRQRQKQ
ncbi:hypothetical protein ALC53_05311 [Atta colombica]|uniref:Uncharacterized protein n=1 Tax=Atta colombica TaxID=520822 RepID=A0A195BJI0_9HYME|nr:hypothetical protein ALC53_05311 [Atta colombica]